MSDIQDLTELLVQFRDERDWGQFHDSKNLALALSMVPLLILASGTSTSQGRSKPTAYRSGNRPMYVY